MIAVILGPDRSLARTEVRRILRERDPDGNSTNWIDGRTTSIRDVAMACASVGFFGTGRIVVVEDLIARLGKQGSKDGGNTPDWSALVGSVPSESTLALFDSSIASVPAMVKRALPGDAHVFLGDPPRGRDLVSWVRREATSEGSSLDDRAARELLDALYPGTWQTKDRNPLYDRPPDMDVLGNEIGKLALGAHPGSIEVGHIHDMVSAGENDRIFSFIDAASTGRTDAAIVELDRLLAAGEDPHRILAQLAGNLELAAVLTSADRRETSSISADLGMASPGRLNAIARTMRDAPRGFAVGVARMLEATDHGMKTGLLRDPVDALYSVVAQIGALRRARHIS